MEVSDFIDFSGLDEAIKKTFRKLEKLDTETCEVRSNKILYEAGDILVAEQRRILSQREEYSGFQPLVRRWTKETRYGRHLYVGYPAHVVKNNIKVMIIEFGRPGSYWRGGLKQDQRDKKGRRIGVVQPYPHIRAAWFIKKNEVNNFMKERILEEMKKIWEEENG